MTEAELFLLAMSIAVMIFVGAFGYAFLYDSKYKDYTNLWLTIWLGPPLVKLWMTLVTFITLS
jgi:hypothetical protein